MRTLVVGAGVFGAWSARFLAAAGHDITLVDAYGPANGRASSADFSRVIRAGYGRDAIYSRWATASLTDWLALSDESGQALLARTGALFLGEPGNTYVADTHDTLQSLGIAVERLAPAAMAARYPQIATDGLGDAVFEPGAGVIRARAALHALTGILARTARVTYLPAAVLPPDENAAACRVVTREGRPLDADAYVFACGPWLPQVLPAAVGPCIRPTRQEVLYFGPPAGDGRFSAARLPVWIDFAAGVYGIPDLDAVGFKIGIDRHGAPVDADTLDRTVDAALVASTRAWMGHRFPGMHGAALIDARVCQYENTSSGDFILDRHPQWANCWIAGGGSGHGFKHGPAVGRHVAALVAGAERVQERFSLGTKAETAARAVY